MIFKPFQFTFLALSVSLTGFSGCGLFQSAGSGASSAFNKLLSNGVQRRSALDEIEQDRPEYLLDTVFRKSRNSRTAVSQQNQDKARGLFDQAESTYKQGIAVRESSIEKGAHIPLLNSAAKTYLRAADAWINSAMEQDALFKAGESYFFAEYYKKANDVFERLVKDYPGTRYMDAVMARRFSIAQYWMELKSSSPQHPLVVNLTDESRPMRDTAGNAMRILDRMRIDDPTGKLADDATVALANAYFEMGQYLDAADTYEDLRLNFPNSEHQFHSQLSEMKARLMAYQGPHYDGTHLETADKLLNAILAQFPNEVDEHRELLTREKARIRKMKGERLMALGSYYEGRGEYRAASLQYQQIAAEYPRTPLAEDATTRLAKISDKPSKTSDPPAWVANIFPESKPAEPIFGTGLKNQLR